VPGGGWERDQVVSGRMTAGTRACDLRSERGRGSSWAGFAMPGGLVRMLGRHGMRLAAPDQPFGGANADSGGPDPFDAVELPVYR
jgi:hypothetical protein